MNSKTYVIALMVIAMSSAHCQEPLPGSVLDGNTMQGIPYAAVHLANTCIGTYCNEAGRFVLHIPQGMEPMWVVVSSLGYRSDTVEVRSLAKERGVVLLQPDAIQLNDVTVEDYGSARKLMNAVVERISQNYRSKAAVGIWAYRNRQWLNDCLFVKSEGLIRNYMPPYGTMLEVRSTDWASAMYRVYQSLDSVSLHDMAYWRSLIGPEDLDRKMSLGSFVRPSDLHQALSGDCVNYMRKKSLRMFSKQSRFMMETFSQGGTDYYRVTIAFRPQGGTHCDTVRLIIDKDDLAIVEAEQIKPWASYMPDSKLLRKYTFYKYFADRRYSGRMYWRYHKYNGKYPLDFIRYEYEQWLDLSQLAKEEGCPSSCLKISGKEECFLSEHSYEGVEEYRRRYYDNKHPLTEENIQESERILREPHNRMPW